MFYLSSSPLEAPFRAVLSQRTEGARASLTLTRRVRPASQFPRSAIRLPSAVPAW